MEKSITGPIGEFGEPKPLFRVEPLHDRSDGRTGGCLEPRLAESRSGSEMTGLCVVGLNVEVPTPRITKILICQLGVPRQVRFNDSGEAQGLTRIDQVGFLATGSYSRTQEGAH